MSEEEMNRKMEFIVEQQAKFAAEIEILRDLQEADARRLSNGLMGLMDIVGNLMRAHLETDQSINRLAAAQTKTDERLRDTDERLRILLNVVERHISGNGGSTNPT